MVTRLVNILEHGFSNVYSHWNHLRNFKKWCLRPRYSSLIDTGYSLGIGIFKSSLVILTCSSLRTLLLSIFLVIDEEVINKKIIQKDTNGLRRLRSSVSLPQQESFPYHYLYSFSFCFLLLNTQYSLKYTVGQH